MDFCIGLGSVSFKCWVSQRKGMIRFQGFSFTITTFCLLPSREQWLLNTFDFLTWKGQSEPRNDTVASSAWHSLFSRVTEDRPFLFPVPVGGRFVTISPNAPTWLGTNPIVIKIDMLLDCLLQTLLQGQFGSTSTEHQDITVMDKDDVHTRSLWGSKLWLGVTMHRLPGRRSFQSKGYLACFWN